MPIVYLKENEGQFELIRNGKPFYMKGGAAEAKYLKNLKQAGANTARIYDTTKLKQTLDLAQELKLAVVVDIPMPRYYTDPQFYENAELFEQLRNKVVEVVKKHNSHPALLYWNLGNELYYPYFYKKTKFHSRFNNLIDLIHELDPNHPVSTTTIGANKLRVISIRMKSPQLDFISFNSFGVLSSFEDHLRPIRPFWNGPLVITEWGINGPWEAEKTSWRAPIEETSTKKAEHIAERYYHYIKPLKKNNSLGSFIFYWGQKNEVTPTWYSLFNGDLKSEAVFQLTKIWTGEETSYPGPKLDYLLMNGKGAAENIIIAPGERTKATVKLPKDSGANYTFFWEVREESWYAFNISKEIAGVNFQQLEEGLFFNAPEKEGPYRLHLLVTNNTGFFASANIPFYVLNPSYEE
jgi:hypothetical protein